MRTAAEGQTATATPRGVRTGAGRAIGDGPNRHSAASAAPGATMVVGSGSPGRASGSGIGPNAWAAAGSIGSGSTPGTGTGRRVGQAA